MVECRSRSICFGAFARLESGGDHEFVIDTGFNGSLYVPEDLIGIWNLPFVSSMPISLADKNMIIVDVFVATLVWFGAALRVAVLAGPSGCESLLGMELLEGCPY